MEESTVQVSTAIGSTVADVCTVQASCLFFLLEDLRSLLFCFLVDSKMLPTVLEEMKQPSG